MSAPRGHRRVDGPTGLTAGEPSPPPPETSGILGILIPCRNEGRVIERKLRNLSLLEWPDSERAHRVCVIDDASTDDTLKTARSIARELSDDNRFAITVVENGIRPGKPGAIAQGLEELEAPGRVQVDWIVLSDADVVLGRNSLLELDRAFGDDPRLAMACGTQRFVQELPQDGCPPEHPSSAADVYDRLTQLVRRFESRFGRLFSVHGQLLAWRNGLHLRPSPGVAADDLDLMLQLRGSPVHAGSRVCSLAEAPFYEVKTPPGEGAREQGLRRARAYVQVVRNHRPRQFADLWARLQWMFYRYVLLGAPSIGLVLVSGLPLLSAWIWGVPTGAGVALALLLLALSAPGRSCVRLMMLIRAATRLEARETLPEQWEMARPH